MNTIKYCNNNISEKNTSNEINYLLNSFKFNNDDFKYEINETIFWFEGNKILTFLGYDDNSDVIDKYIKNTYIKTLNELKGDNALIDDSEKNTIYISEYGLNQLLSISKSDNVIVKLFQDKLFEEILPSIRKIGNYNHNETNFIVSETKKIYFNENDDFNPYLNQNVVYIGETGETKIIGDENKMIYKFGKSSRSIDKDFKEFKKIFTNFKMIFILHCDNNDAVEENFKMELMTKNMLYEPPKKPRKKKYNTKCDKKQNLNVDEKQIGLLKPSSFNKTFVLTEKFDLNYVVDLMQNLVNEFPLESIKEKDETIKELKLNNKLKEKEIDLKIKEEETKQIEKKLELEKMKIELEKLKIELEIKKKISEVDSNNSIKHHVSNLCYDQNECSKIKIDKTIINSSSTTNDCPTTNILDNKNEIKLPKKIYIESDMHFLMTDDIFKNDVFRDNKSFKKSFEIDTTKIKKWKEQINNTIFNYSNMKNFNLCNKLKEYTIVKKIPMLGSS